MGCRVVAREAAQRGERGSSQSGGTRTRRRLVAPDSSSLSLTEATRCYPAESTTHSRHGALTHFALSNVTRARRAILGAAIVVVALAPGAGQGQSIKVTLLGTGCPPAVMNRFGPSTLVEAGGQKFVFDAGRGALQRLTQLGVRWQDVQGVFLTHLHSDHVVGFPDLWLTGWLIAPGRNVPLPVWGPSGTSSMMAHLERAYEADINVRIVNDGVAPDGAKLLAHDITEGVVYDHGGVTITAFEVDHAPMKPAFGYRVDYAGRSVVLSGDTRVSENLVRHAQRVDLLVHEVFVPETLKRLGMPPERAKNIVAYHVTPEQAGEVFTRTRPRLAVYSHICMPAAAARDVLAPTRTTYSGPLEVGEDLMVIDVGEKLTVRRPPRASP
jgi:ribonuclease Z